MKCMEDIKIVIDYIEDNINQLDMDSISRLTGIPKGLYQRIFTYMCGVSISEYVRKRRMTIAAYSLLQNSDKIIDIALEFGYDTHSSFTRAFKEQFDVPPISLTYEIYEKRAYHRLSFEENTDTYYVIKGRKVMAELVKIEYQQMDKRMLIGISKTDMDVVERELWGIYFEDGYAKQLSELSDYHCSDMKEDYLGIGYACDFENEKSLGNVYLVGAYFNPKTPVPENMISKIIPQGMVAKAQIKGENIDNIINNAYILISDMVQKNGYRLDYDNFYWSEVYTCERYGNPAHSGADELILDWYMPCIKIE